MSPSAPRPSSRHTPILNLAALALGALLGFPSSVHALPLEGLDCITENRLADCAIAEGQITGSIVEGDAGTALLTFTNLGPEAAVIRAVYIESGLVTGIDPIHTSGVSFSVGGSPRVLPGGNKIFSPAVFATADPAPPKKGIGPLESGTFVLTLSQGGALADLDDLRIGIHVIAFDSGGSESLVTQPVPEPSPVLLLSLGIGLLWVARRNRRHGVSA
jgi:hypothetical protein